MVASRVLGPTKSSREVGNLRSEGYDRAPLGGGEPGRLSTSWEADAALVRGIFGALGLDKGSGSDASPVPWGEDGCGLLPADGILVD